jgi:hypothetical protein
MPSTINTTVGANYLKAAPSTRFGTRQLLVLNIAVADVFVGHALADSLFSKTIRALQQTAEIWAVFTPVDDTTDSFNVIISADSQWSGDSANQGIGGVTDNAGFGILETAIAAGNGGVSATVTVPAGFVTPFYRANTAL